MNESSASNVSRANASFKFVPEPFGMTVVRLALFSVVFLTAVVGNVVVFTASLRNRRLRTFSYCLITNLAVSDFISVLGVPLLVVNEQLRAGWIFGDFLCRVLNPTQVVCGMVTTNVHVAIAVDRYLSILHPFRDRLSTFRAALVVLLVWLVAVFCSLPLFGFRVLRTFTLKSGLVKQFCVEEFPPMGDSALGFRHLYSVFLFFVNYFVPIALSTALYAKIVLHLKKTEFRRRRSRRKTSIASKSSIERHSTYLERRFIAMAFIVVMIFLFCYLPYQIVFLLFEFDHGTNWPYIRILLKIVFFATWLPNALNPICYGAMDKHYSKAFKKLCSSLQSDRSTANNTGSLSRSRGQC